MRKAAPVLGLLAAVALVVTLAAWGTSENTQYLDDNDPNWRTHLVLTVEIDQGAHFTTSVTRENGSGLNQVVVKSGFVQNFQGVRYCGTLVLQSTTGASSPVVFPHWNGKQCQGGHSGLGSILNTNYRGRVGGEAYRLVLIGADKEHHPGPVVNWTPA